MIKKFNKTAKRGLRQTRRKVKGGYIRQYIRNLSRRHKYKGLLFMEKKTRKDFLDEKLVKLKKIQAYATDATDTTILSKLKQGVRWGLNAVRDIDKRIAAIEEELEIIAELEEQHKLALKLFGFNENDKPSKKDITTKYKNLSLLYHPDRGSSDTVAFKEIANAKDLLLQIPDSNWEDIKMTKGFTLPNETIKTLSTSIQTPQISSNPLKYKQDFNTLAAQKLINATTKTKATTIDPDVDGG